MERYALNSCSTASGPFVDSRMDEDYGVRVELREAYVLPPPPLPDSKASNSISRIETAEGEIDLAPPQENPGLDETKETTTALLKQCPPPLSSKEPINCSPMGTGGGYSELRTTAGGHDTAPPKHQEPSDDVSRKSPRHAPAATAVASSAGPHRTLYIKDVLENRLTSTDSSASSSVSEVGTKSLLVLEFHDLTYRVNHKKSGLMRTNDQAESLMTAFRSRSPPASGQGAPAAAPPAQSSRSPREPSRLTLLDRVSGEARDGEILAVMGPSGSGKSTLIDALAQRVVPESLTGRITLNGEQVSDSLLRSISAYVMQNDLLYPMLTVKETLLFAAEVRLPMKLHSRERKQERVNQLLQDLGLHSVANTIIGDEGHRGVSGGERRRVSIGIDIVHDPLLLFLDEPTSGLDSTSAYLVVRMLQNIARTGSLVILSIHQPSYRILGLLDRLIILAFGQKIYGGPPTGLDSFYEAFGRPVPEHENSTEHALDLILELHTSPTGIGPLVQFSKDWADRNGNGLKQLVGKDLVDANGAITASMARGKLVATPGCNNNNPHGSKDCARAQAVPELRKLSSTSGITAVSKFANPWWWDVKVLMWRSLINIGRMPELFFMRLGTVIVTGFLLATVFWGLDRSPSGVQERLGFFAFAMSTTFYTCADALPVFLQERYIFMRETAHNAYRKSSYVLAHALLYVPFLAVLSIAFAITTWWAVGLAGGGGGFGFFFLIIWSSFWVGNSFVTLLSALLPNVVLGYTIVVAILAYFLLLSGFFISRDRIPKYWIWFHYISIIKYPYEAVLINEFDRPGSCYERGSQILDGTPLAGISDPALLAGILSGLRTMLVGTPYENMNASSCITSGNDILMNRQVNELSKWQLLGVTVSFGIFFRLLFYACLRWGTKNMRK